MQYEILSASGGVDENDRSWGADEQLEQKVQDYIAKGWRPIGGVSATYVDKKDKRSRSGGVYLDLVQCFQAMVKD